MKLNVTKNTTAGEINRQFRSAYPFLKLEFLIMPDVQSVSKHPVIATDNTRLGSIRPTMKEGAIVINDNTTVGELEMFFRNHMLDVQVFRQSSNLWLETTMTDKWSLEKQNSHGKEISEFKLNTTPDSDLDYNLANDTV